MNAEKQKTILLVDDEVIIAMTEKMTLEKYGYIVITAYTGEEAVAIIEATPGIDLILMDINLGAGMDGTEAAALILKDRDLPVVFLSSHTEPEVVAKTEKITSYGYVVKNSSITVLDASIKMAFKLFEAKIKEKKKEAALLASEVRFRRISAITSDIAYSCRAEENGRFAIDWVMGAIDRITGYSGKEIKEQGCWRFLVVEEDQALFDENVTGLALGAQGSCELRIRHKNGDIVWITSFAECVSEPQTPGQLILYGGMVDISKRKHAESRKEAAIEMLQMERDRAQQYLDIAGVILISLAPDQTIVLINKRGYELLGYTQEELVGKNWFDVVLPECERENIKAIFDRLIRGELEPLERVVNRLVTRSGEERLVKWHNTLLRDAAGNIVSVLSSGEDITERKQAEAQKEAALETLRESEDRYRDLVENSQDLICTHDLEGKILSMNETAVRLTGYPLTELLGMNMADLLVPEVRHLFNAYLTEIQAKGWSRGTMRIQTASGEHRYWEYYNTLRTRDVTVPVVRALGHDITERERGEQALQESEERYRSIINNSPDGISIMDMNGRIIMVSPALLAMIGCERKEEMLGRLFADFVSPEDLHRASSDVSLMPQNSKMGLNEYHCLRADGSAFAVEVNGDFVRDANGRPTQMVFIIRDITARRLAESQKEAVLEALRESEDWNKAILQTVLSGVMVIEVATRKIVEVNDTALKLIGLPKEQVIGAVCHRFVCPAEEKSCPVLDLGQDVDLSEKILLTALGKRRNIIKTVVPVQWHGRKYLMESFVDITERKRAETIQQIQYTIANAMIKAETLSDFLETVRSELSSLIDTTNFLLALYNEASGMLSAPFEKDEKDAIPQWPAEKSLTGLVLKQKHSLLLREEEIQQLDEAGSTEQIGSNAKAWLGVPLQINDKKLGVIVVQSYDNADAYDQSSVNLMEMIASQLSVYIERKQAEVEIQRQLAEKEMLLKEVHHRIKNNIASIAGLISLRLQSVSNPEAAAVLQDAVGRVNSMRILYDKLLLTEDYKDLSVKNYAEDLSDLVVTLFPDSARITVKKRITDFNLDAKTLFPLGIIINELLTNKMKYAFSNRDSGIIKITLENADRHVTLAIEDDGNGLPEGFDIDQSKGFGLMLVKMLSQQLGGSFSMEKQAGTRCVVEFDI